MLLCVLFHDVCCFLRPQHSGAGSELAGLTELLVRVEDEFYSSRGRSAFRVPSVTGILFSMSTGTFPPNISPTAL